jgi:small GTP-binding protein
MSELALQLIEKEKQERTGKLNIGLCGLTEIPEAVAELSWLKTLIIGNFQYIEEDNKWVKSPNQGKFNHISDLTPLTKLLNLQQLDFSSTQVDDLAPLANLHKLKKLHCSSTQIFDLTPLANLLNLQQLYCYSTQVSDLAPLANLQYLRFFDCDFTQVSDLRPVKHLVGVGNISFSDCPLLSPPMEFAEESNEAILEYFEQLDVDSRNLNELKVIFLGEGASGKTSLIRRLRKEAFNPKENQTHGIRIRKTPFDIDGETVDAHLWDFGGQEVMHATHQFFLSQRCIYVLVLNSRTDDKAEYWLKHANSFGGKSPVLVVLNKIDENPSFEVNRKVLSEKYPQIKGYYRLSCQTDVGIGEFEQALQEQIRQSDTRRTPFPTAWLAVKNGCEQKCGFS